MPRLLAAFFEHRGAVLPAQAKQLNEPVFRHGTLFDALTQVHPRGFVQQARDGDMQVPVPVPRSRPRRFCVVEN